jgi:hypothetical protein
MLRIPALALAAAAFSAPALARDVIPCIPEARAQAMEKETARRVGADHTKVMEKYLEPMTRALPRVAGKSVRFRPVKIIDITTPAGSILAFYKACGLAQVEFLTPVQRKMLDEAIIGDEI